MQRIGETLISKGILTPAQVGRVEKEIDESPCPARQPSFGEKAKEVIQQQGLSEAIEKIERARRIEWNSHDLREALKTIHEGKAILFVGAGFSGSEEPRAPARELSGESIKLHLIACLKQDAKRTKKKISKEIAGLANESLGMVAQVFEALTTRDRLTLELESLCKDNLPIDLLDHHRIVAALPNFQFIVTSNWDRLIERAFEEERVTTGRRIQIVREDEDVSRLDLSRPALIKIYGDYDRDAPKFRKSPTITLRDFMEFERSHPALLNLLQTLFLSHPVVVVGFRPDDYNYRRLLESTAHLTKERQHPIYVIDPNEYFAESLTYKRMRFIKMNGGSFLEWTKRYIENDGTCTGVSYHGRLKKRRGAIRIWAPEACELADRLRSKFPRLSRIEVVCPPLKMINDLEYAKVLVGRRAAKILRESVTPGTRVALSCGSTLKVLAESASPLWREFQNVRLYSTSIPAFEDCSGSAPLSLITGLARTLEEIGVEGRAYQLPVGFVKAILDKKLQPYIGGGRGRTVPELRSAVTSYLNAASKADVFFLGVGAIGDESTGYYKYAKGCMKSSTITAGKQNIDNILSKYLNILCGKYGFVGDVMYRPFQRVTTTRTTRTSVRAIFMNAEKVLERIDKSTHTRLTRSLSEFVARLAAHVHSINPDELLKATNSERRTVALVASGRGKAEALSSLCRAGVGDTIIIDAELAQGMLNN